VPVTLTVHQAVFFNSTVPHHFLKVRNWTDEPIQLNRLWFASDPPVDVVPMARPLPTVIGPGDLFESWIPTHAVAATVDIDFLGRAEFANGLTVESVPNQAVAPGGIVGGMGTPLDALVESVADLNHHNGQLIRKDWDVFISHAGPDKAGVVEPLANALKERGLRVWYDRFEMHLGDSLRRKIDEGIAGSRFGAVVLSPAFFGRPWTDFELDGIIAAYMYGGQRLLPIWHNVTVQDVQRFSPFLADKVACSTDSRTIDEIADLVAEVIRRAVSD